MLKGLWYVFKSVLFEELLFRGALLYILIKRIGPAKAVLISAIAFGIYHWFTIGFGKPTQMAYIFLVMGLAGYAFAKAFGKTGTILLPFALHFGFNVAIMILFSQNSGIGPQLFRTGCRTPCPYDERAFPGIDDRRKFCAAPAGAFMAAISKTRAVLIYL